MINKNRLLAGIFLIAILLLNLELSRAMSDDFTNSRTEAKNLIAGERSGLSAITSTMPAEDFIPGFQGGAVPQTALTNEDLADPNSGMIDDVANDAGAAILTSNAGNFTIDEDEVQGALAIQRDPNGNLDIRDLLSSSYSACQGGDFAGGRPSETLYCDGWRTADKNKCKISRIVDVEAKVRYQCNRDAPRILTRCDNKLDVQCTKKGDCSAADIVFKSGRSSNAGDFPTALHPQNEAIFTVGKQRKSIWREHHLVSGSQRDTVFSFYLRNKASISIFSLSNVHYQSWLSVRVNGHSVYFGPKWGDENEWIHTRGLQTVCVGRHHRNNQCQDWAQIQGNDYTAISLFDGTKHILVSTHQPGTDEYVNIDILPHIRNGSNKIEIRSVTGYSTSKRRTYYGHAWLDFYVKAACCLTWSENWEESCE